ncbi:hypothetical protein AB0F93_00360 [Micromonospora tulbaghiae]|uniref:hypothetical protein n=1 Tax=Micromonospora tulbaghiae TaxID=479978 RepID=UPI0033343702
MFVEQVRRGTLVNGRRVVGLSPTLRSGQKWITVTLEPVKRGKRGEQLSFREGTRVPGTRPRTDLPAGPVRSGPPALFMAAGRRDGESAGDRHSRMIGNIVYGG